MKFPLTLSLLLLRTFDERKLRIFFLVNIIMIDAEIDDDTKHTHTHTLDNT